VLFLQYGVLSSKLLHIEPCRLVVLLTGDCFAGVIQANSAWPSRRGRRNQ